VSHNKIALSGRYPGVGECPDHAVVGNPQGVGECPDHAVVGNSHLGGNKWIAKRVRAEKGASGSRTVFRGSLGKTCGAETNHNRANTTDKESPNR
jgi:hypothetical protein